MLTWDDFDEPNSGLLAHYQIVRRSGAVVLAESSEIAIVMRKAFVAVFGSGACIAGAGLLNRILANSPLTAPAIFKCGMFATTSSTKQHLFALFKLVGAMIKLQPGKANGFFSASKANLRNAP